MREQFYPRRGKISLTGNKMTASTFHGYACDGLLCYDLVYISRFSKKWRLKNVKE